MSKAALAIAHLKKVPSARSAELATVMGCSVANVTNNLAVAVKRGELVVCKVTSGSGQVCNEYRIGAGMPMVGEKPLDTSQFRIRSHSRVEDFSSRPPGKTKPPAAPPPKAEPAEVSAPAAATTPLSAHLTALQQYLGEGQQILVTHEAVTVIALGHHFPVPPKPGAISELLDASRQLIAAAI